MKKFLLILSLLSFSAIYSQSSDSTVIFKDYFRFKTLRFDFNLGGDHNSETVFPVGFKMEPFWGGTLTHLIDPFNYGTYRVVLKDSATGKTIYTKGFANLFQEWQGTPEAGTLKRTFYQVVTMPYPKNPVILNIDKREYSTGLFKTLFSISVNPDDYRINQEVPVYYPSVRFKTSGEPSAKVDIAFLADGYSAAEMSKFRKDAERMANEILSIKPYSDYKDRFNFYEVESASAESGTDIPGEKIYFNTVMNSSFWTFGTDRYLTTSDLKSVYDAAANVPYDAIIILVNSKKYGGGGFYNMYAESTADNDYSAKVVVHEFGHSFAGLADEYVGSVNYSDFYNISVEPWEPNITTNVDFAGKWKNLIKKDTPVPTPRTSAYDNVIGMFEGGGYMSTGIYSPQNDCRMRTNEAPGFCGACQQAITKMIKFYSE